MIDSLGELLAEVFEAFFQFMKSTFRRKSRSKKSVPDRAAAPT
jgi:hypothetical protein